MRNVNAYQHFIADSIKGLYFNGICDYANQEETYEQLDEIEFL